MSKSLAIRMLPPAWDNTFVFLLAHSSRGEAEKNWEEMAADPAFQEIIKSEQKERLLDKANTTYMRPDRVFSNEVADSSVHKISVAPQCAGQAYRTL
jgi:hypothetical protein